MLFLNTAFKGRTKYMNINNFM